MIPEELRRGDRLTADWINRLVREAVSRTLYPGPGIRISKTPTGTTLSLAPRGRAGRPFAGDFAWRVTVTTDGEGGAVLDMAPGALVVDTANGPSMLTGIRLGSDYRHISATGYVFVRYATDVTAATARFAANVPANTSDYNYLPVAKVTKDGVDYAVEQYLAGAFFAYVTVDEEV